MRTSLSFSAWRAVRPFHFEQQGTSAVEVKIAPARLESSPSVKPPPINCWRRVNVNLIAAREAVMRQVKVKGHKDGGVIVLETPVPEDSCDREPHPTFHRHRRHGSPSLSPSLFGTTMRSRHTDELAADAVEETFEPRNTLGPRQIDGADSDAERQKSLGLSILDLLVDQTSFTYPRCHLCNRTFLGGPGPASRPSQAFGTNCGSSQG